MITETHSVCVKDASFAHPDPHFFTNWRHRSQYDELPVSRYNNLNDEFMKTVHVKCEEA